MTDKPENDQNTGEYGNTPDLGPYPGPRLRRDTREVGPIAQALAENLISDALWSDVVTIMQGESDERRGELYALLALAFDDVDQTMGRGNHHGPFCRRVAVALEHAKRAHSTNEESEQAEAVDPNLVPSPVRAITKPQPPAVVPLPVSAPMPVIAPAPSTQLAALANKTIAGFQPTIVHYPSVSKAVFPAVLVHDHLDHWSKGGSIPDPKDMFLPFCLEATGLVVVSGMFWSAYFNKPAEVSVFVGKSAMREYGGVLIYMRKDLGLDPGLGIDVTIYGRLLQRRLTYLRATLQEKIWDGTKYTYGLDRLDVKVKYVPHPSDPTADKIEFVPQGEWERKVLGR